MKTVEIQGKNYNLPETWEDLNLKQLKKIVLIKDFLEDEDFKTFIEIITGESKEVILNDWDKEDLNKLDLSFMSTYPQMELQKTFEIKGVKYGIEKDLNKIKAGCYLDANGYAKKNILENVVACIVRPMTFEENDSYEIEKYDSNNVEDRGKLFFDNISGVQIMAITNFFLGGKIK